MHIHTRKIGKTWIVGILGVCTVFNPSIVNAQVLSDGTLSTEVITGDSKHFDIEGGNLVGRNLFHSFEEFSVPAGGTANFGETVGIQNLIGRVTGNKPSRIDGKIVQSGEPISLFLINPNGIIFGTDSEISINGSLIVTTANEIEFADGESFGTELSTGAASLTVSLPVGLQFGQNPGAIVTRSTVSRMESTSPFPPSESIPSEETPPSFEILPSDAPFFEPPPTSQQTPVGLTVRPKNTVALLGGEVVVEGEGNTRSLERSPNLFSPFTSINAPGGRIEIGGIGSNERIRISPSSEGWHVDYGEVTYFEDVKISRALFNVIQPEGVHGSIRIRGNTISIVNESQLTGASSVAGLSGNILVSASDLLLVSQFSSINALSEGEGTSGNISIKAREFFLTEGAFIDTRTLGIGEGGDISIEVDDYIEINGFGGLSKVSAESNSDGMAGNIVVNADELRMNEGGQISTSAGSSGRGGNIIVRVNGEVSIIGFIEVDLPFLEEVRVLKSGFFSGSQGNASGDGGEITLHAKGLSIHDGAELSASADSESTGQSGRITIATEEFVSVMGEDSSLLAENFGSEKAGDLRISTQEFTISDGASVSVSNTGSGDAGTLAVQASDLFLADGAQLSAATASGNGGNIDIDLQNTLDLRRGSSISTTAGRNQGGGNGGNIDIDAKFVTAVPAENSDITANAFAGRGGNVDITADGVFGIAPRDAQTNLSDITATSETDVDGTVTINSPDLETNRDVVEEPDTTAPPKIARDCQAGRIQTASSFVDIGRGGLPPTPAQSLNSAAVWEDLRPLANRDRPPATVSSAPPIAPPPPQTAIVEASGWIVNESGDIELVTNAPNAIAVASPPDDRTCRDLAANS